MAPAQDAVEEQQQDQDDVPETQPLLVRAAQQQPAAAASVANSSDKPATQLAAQPGSPTKSAAAQVQQTAGPLAKQGSGIGRVKSQELGQCRYV